MAAWRHGRDRPPRMEPTSPNTASLRANALSFSSVLTQGITHIAPAMGLVVTVQFVTTMAGIASPLAYGVAFLIVMLLGVCLAQLALHLPSAGGYYTYVCRSLNPRARLLTSPCSEISAAFVMWLTVVEIFTIIVLAITSLLHPGDGRLHLQDFVSLHDVKKKGFYLAIVFSIFTFTGFEANAPLPQETANPRRTIP